MQKRQVLGPGGVCLVLLIVAAGCGDESTEFMGLTKSIDLGRFFESPSEYEGYHVAAVGQLALEGDLLSISSFEEDIHPDVPEGEMLLIDDVLFDEWLSKADPDNNCVGRKVEVAGILGKLEAPKEIGVISIEAIFLAKDVPYFSRGEPCYINESAIENEN